MTKNRHHGVGVIITNYSRDLFYIQQKDENYPVIKYRLAYSFFGGEIKQNENEFKALERELVEELEPTMALNLIRISRKFDDFEVTSTSGTYTFSLYEAILSNNELEKISEYPIKEGKRGILVTREEIQNIRFIHHLERVLQKYLSSR